MNFQEKLVFSKYESRMFVLATYLMYSMTVNNYTLKIMEIMRLKNLKKLCTHFQYFQCCCKPLWFKSPQNTGQGKRMQL